MQWLSQTLLACIYPGAPYERKYLAMLLLNTLLDAWNAPDAGCKSYTKPSSQKNSSSSSTDAGVMVVGDVRFQAFCDGFFGPQTTQLLLGELLVVIAWSKSGCSTTWLHIGLWHSHASHLLSFLRQPFWASNNKTAFW